MQDGMLAHIRPAFFILSVLPFRTVIQYTAV